VFGIVVLVSAKSVVKQHGSRFTLGPVDLELRSGEVLGIIGEPGAGKTTLLKLIWGFLRPDQGSISVFHLKPHLNQLSVRQRTGYLSESPGFDRCRTARQYVRFAAPFYEGWNEATVQTLLERFRIDPEICVQDLSDVEKVKLALISTIGHDPFLLLLDDPMARLNAHGQVEISEFLKTLSSERDLAVLMSAQHSSSLLPWTDSILRLIDGKMES
ncbi:MAG TPA: ABC transporter ATP-binding protein, partial [Terriglobia bacterium]|nr:ABC transporter ATP-binding protein [Terriglobia bacterium]